MKNKIGKKKFSTLMILMAAMAAAISGGALANAAGSETAMPQSGGNGSAIIVRATPMAEGVVSSDDVEIVWQ